MNVLTLIEALHCPCCGAGFTVDVRRRDTVEDIDYGILRCACYRYPVIEGIPVLRQNSGPGDTDDIAAQRIQDNDFAGALAYVLKANITKPPPTFIQRLQRRAAKQYHRKPDPFLNDLAHYRTPTYADYLYQRYANSSFLSAIPLILMLRRFFGTAGHAGRAPRALDLGSGIGHASHVMTTAIPELAVVAADYDFINLYQARRYVVPHRPCVCLDAEIPLPFADDVFDVVFCMDAFHYIRSKVALVREFDRVANQAAVLLLPHLHNALSDRNQTPGIPLSQEDYRRVLAPLPLRMFRESDVLDSFVDDGSVDLTGRPDGVCPEGDVYSLVASRREDLWRRVEQLDTILLEQPKQLSVNPIYKVAAAGDGVYLEMQWPNEILEQECSDVTRFLKPTWNIEGTVWQDFVNGRSQDAIRALVRRFVLVTLPPGYSAS